MYCPVTFFGQWNNRSQFEQEREERVKFLSLVRIHNFLKLKLKTEIHHRYAAAKTFTHNPKNVTPSPNASCHHLTKKKSLHRML